MQYLSLLVAASAIYTACADGTAYVGNQRKVVDGGASCLISEPLGEGQAYYWNATTECYYLAGGEKPCDSPPCQRRLRFHSRRALHERRAAEAEFIPEDDTALFQGTDNFFNVSTADDVDCFLFDHIEGADGDLAICGTGVMIDESYDPPVQFVRNGFLDVGSWTWQVNYTDGSLSDKFAFTMGLAESDPEYVPVVADVESEMSDEPQAISDQEWPYEGQIQYASGRIYYQVGGGERNLACSGTVIRDNKSGRSLILTAAHCVYDDIYGQFGENVIFIPNRHNNLGSNLTDEERADIHRSCEEDPCGCWSLSAGFVLQEWKSNLWPENLPYDWGVWVVDDVGQHEGGSMTNGNCGSDALDQAVPEMEFDLGIDLESFKTYGMGYSLEHNPDFHYCEDAGSMETLSNYPDVTTWWIPACQLNPGSSGGPWVVNMDVTTGKGSLVTVNSWSYADRDGNGGPIIDASTARCLINAARDADFEAIFAEEAGFQGIFVECFDRPCVVPSDVGGDEETSTRKLGVSRNARGDIVHSHPEGRVLCETHE
ncbi:expressed unknown protein [Seminavis robusta]|uniref:Uncharacterized protein n=1 Tax=Seminavis robusta TaxID=568900 RepID=A0A9N8DW25_9STRA|nr:expressed unknown protein [Seminavis robusta]|eukprot:Sro394_g133780.1 n/a (542) ;mRNA; r:13786-15411